MNTPRHFTFAEMTETGTGLANSLDNWTKCANLLRTAIRVNSGYRSHAVNKAIGRTRTSAHLKGLADDYWSHVRRVSASVPDTRAHYAAATIAPV